MFQVLLSLLAFVVACLALYRAYRDHKLILSEKTKLEGQIDELQKVLKFRGHLATEIAHEIKNPITAILCSAETLALVLDDKLDESQKLSLKYILEYGENLHKLVSDFLDLSRAEAGNLERKLERVELSETVQSVTGLLNAIAERKGIKLQNFTKGRGVFVKSDPVHLKQILFNLVHNAIKFTAKGGEIFINCTNASEEKKVLISVEDTGIGIPQDKIQSLFQPYVQANNGSSQTVIITETGVPQQGVGIGLALCKSLVELAGGQIKVSSVVGKGSIFSFTASLSEDQPKTSKAISRPIYLNPPQSEQ